MVFVKEHPFKSILLLLLTLGLLRALAWGVLARTDFCWEQKRWLSDGEKIEAVIEYQNGRKSIPVYEKESKKYYNYAQVKYGNAEEYWETYPSCCALNPGGPHGISAPSISKKLDGFWGDVVVMDYYIRYLDDDGQLQVKKTKFENEVSNCGKVI